MKPAKQETRSAVVLHENYISPSGMEFCTDNDLLPVVVPKHIARYSLSRYSWGSALMNAVSLATGPMALFGAAHELLKMDPGAELPAALLNFDIRDDLLKKRCGIPSRALKGADAFYSYFQGLLGENLGGDNEKFSMDPGEITRAIASLITLKSYADAIANYADAEDGPTIEELDGFVAHKGAGDPQWFGHMEFEGWDGSPKGLEGLSNEDRTRVVEEGAIVIPPVIPPYAMHYCGNNAGGATGILTVVDDFQHHLYRRMNWHLDEDEFKSTPYDSREQVGDRYWSTKDTKFGSTNRSWLGPGEEKIEALKALGVEPHLSFAGTLQLGDSFKEISSLVGEASGCYDKNEEGADQYWLKSLADFAGTQIATYGVTHAAIIEQLICGYVMIPALSQVDITDRNRDLIKEQFDKRQKEGAPFRFSLDPIFATEALNSVAILGEDRTAFIALCQHNLLPHLGFSEVEAEVDAAMSKLATVIEEAPESQWDWDGGGSLGFRHRREDDEGTLQSVDLDEWSEALDAFTKDSINKWTEAADYLIEHGSLVSFSEENLQENNKTE